MTSSGEPGPRVVLDEGRFARLEAIEWWDRDAVRSARVMVVGAGALGNEVLKNLALLGVGHVLVVDKDRVELSNLCRSVLFREADTGAPKAERAAAAMRGIHPGADVRVIDGDLMSHVGLGWFRWAQVVIGALDNREARLFVNSACARTGTPWIDGGIEVLRGVVRTFAPPGTACYQCTMGRTDWRIVDQRRSCTLLARRAALHRGVPTTPLSASIVGALQAQEALRMLHGLDALRGSGVVYDGASWSLERVSYVLDPACDMHDPVPPVREERIGEDAPLRRVADLGSAILAGCDAVVLSREIVTSLQCPPCGLREDAFGPAERFAEAELKCGRCGGERVPAMTQELPAGSPLLSMTARDLGLPPRDLAWARRGEDLVGFEVGTGD